MQYTEGYNEHSYEELKKADKVDLIKKNNWAICSFNKWDDGLMGLDSKDLFNVTEHDTSSKYLNFDQ
jgi:hypothetical protein